MREATSEVAFGAAFRQFGRSTKSAVTSLESFGYRAATRRMRKAAIDAIPAAELRVLEAWDACLPQVMAELRTHAAHEATCEFAKRSDDRPFLAYEVRFAHAPTRSAILLCREYLAVLQQVIEEAKQWRAG